MDLVFSQNLKPQAKKLADTLKEDDIIWAIKDNIECGIQDTFCMIVVLLCQHIEFTEGMEAVCYDDISEVAKRLKIMVEHD